MYSIDDNNGELIATGLDERIAMTVAHELADQIGQPVWLYLSPATVENPGHPIMPARSK